MRKNYLHLDFKGVTPFAASFPEYLEHFAKLGYDGLILELDCKYAWQTWKGATLDHFNKQEVENIIQTAKTLGFEVSLLIQSLGHLEWALQHEQYAHLRENGFINEICPCNPEAVAKIDEWIDEAFSLCPDAPYLHLGGDEVWHLCSCPECLKYSENQPDQKMSVFLRHLKHCCEKVIASGKQPMIWSDMFVSRKCYEPIKTLPAGTVIVNWCYHEKAPFAGLQEMLSSGYEIWGSPAIRCGWFPDYLSGLYDEKGISDRIANIREWQQTGLNLLNTVWGRPSSLNILYSPWHCFADAFAAAGTKSPTWNSRKSEDKFAEQSRLWQALDEEYRKLFIRGKLIFQCSAGLNTVRKYIGRRPGLFKADCYDQAERLAKDIEIFRQKLQDFFAENDLSDGDEFIEERLAMLTPSIVPPADKELEMQELL